jgi:Ser/Thr protein kinase RdoA (MazF antagonist)
MAVFTDITSRRYREQFSLVEKAFNISIASIESIPAGSIDSKFKICTLEYDHNLVMTIHETPDVTAAGKTCRESMNMLHYVDYLANSLLEVTGQYEAADSVSVLKPLPAYSQSESQTPYLELDFDGIKKPVSIVPFIVGKSFKNSPDELAQPGEVTLAGKALAALTLLARRYPEPSRFEPFDFCHYVNEIKRVLEDGQVTERLGYALSDGQPGRSVNEELGKAYLSEMNEMGGFLRTTWVRILENDTDFTHSLLHGDFFTDNTIIDDKGRLIVFDFSQACNGPIGLDIGIALNSWATQYGRPKIAHVLRFLEAFDSVIRLNESILPLIPAFAQIGAFRWETFRIQRMELQDPRQYPMRSPQEFQSMRKAWIRFQESFADARSVQELSANLSKRGVS